MLSSWHTAVLWRCALPRVQLPNQVIGPGSLWIALNHHELAMFAAHSSLPSPRI